MIDVEDLIQNGLVVVLEKAHASATECVNGKWLRKITTLSTLNTIKNALRPIEVETSVKEEEEEESFDAKEEEEELFGKEEDSQQEPLWGEEEEEEQEAKKENSLEWVKQLTKDCVEEQQREKNAMNKKRPIQLSALAEKQPKKAKKEMPDNIKAYVAKIRKSVESGNIGQLPLWGRVYVSKDEKMPHLKKLERVEGFDAITHYEAWREQQQQQQNKA